jgi:hypothetical protein
MEVWRICKAPKGAETVLDFAECLTEGLMTCNPNAPRQRKALQSCKGHLIGWLEDAAASCELVNPETDSNATQSGQRAC